MSARLLVIGAGLGGLTTALALHAAGFSVELHEQAAVLGEAGAGLTLSRGAQNVFRAIGVQQRLAPFTTRSCAFPFLHYRTGAVLSGELNHGAGLPDDGAADVSRQCHRADLHAVLVERLLECVPQALKLEHRLVGIEETASGVRAVFANGDSAEGTALIGADGVKSAARSILWGEQAPRFMGQVAYRFLVEGSVAVPLLRFGRGAVFLGPQCTFNRYTLRSGGLLNCVALAATGQWTGEGWVTQATREELLAVLAGWHAEVTGLVAVAGRLIKWGLFDRAPLPRWGNGRVMLLGDAAHAMLPFLGMGAAMAIEDAMILARALRADGAIESAFARFEAVRRPRTELVCAASLAQGRLTQSSDPDLVDFRAAPSADPAILSYDPVSAPI